MKVRFPEQPQWKRGFIFFNFMQIFIDSLSESASLAFNSTSTGLVMLSRSDVGSEGKH